MKKHIVKEIKNTKEFNLLVSNLDSYFGKLSHLDVCLEIVPSTVNNLTKLRESICITLFDGSWIRFACSGHGNQLEIASIGVMPSNQNRGLGKYLMKLVFTFIRDTLEFIPPMMLECTGNLFARGVCFQNSTQNQTKFFGNFGFRVTSKKGYTNYVKMELD